MRNLLLLFILLSVLVVAGCKKDRFKPINGVTALIDGHATRFSGFGASYVKGQNYISISATTEKEEVITFRAYVPGPDPLGTILFKANGTNTVAIVKFGKGRRNQPGDPVIGDCSFSDDNQPDLEGQLTITKLDEVNKKVSGTFSFKTYNRALNQYRTVTQGQFTDMFIAVSQTQSRPNSMTCIATPNNEWFSDQVYAVKTLLFGNPVIRIEAMGLQTPVQDVRQLVLQIPLSLGTGTFQVKADSVFQSWNYHRASYHYYFDEYGYNSIHDAGTITVNSIDDVNNRISLSFNLQMKHEDGRTINFTNGQVNATWLE